LARFITISQFRDNPPLQAQLVDVRSPSEFAAGHVPGAVNIPMDQMESRLQDLRSDIPVVLICQAGKRACMTADLLDSSQREIAVLEGGTKAWRQAGLPLVCCTRARWSLERQVRLMAGLLVLTSSLLAITMNHWWVLLCGFAGLGLTFAGLTDICPTGMLLEKMPWNKKAVSCKPAFPVAGPVQDR